MKKYEKPEIKITEFSSDDILTLSDGDYEALNPLPVFFEKPDEE